MRGKARGGHVYDYIALDELEFGFDSEKEIKRFDELWKKGYSVYEIARKMNIDPDRVVVLVLDRKRKHKIKPRPGALFGNKQPKARNLLKAN